MIEELNKCNLCPHKCNVNRNIGELGRCKLGKKPKISLASLHKYEEPPISGENGSGTIFFSHCNMNCMFCQNYKISNLNNGKEITVEKLADIMLELQEKKAENINLVTPTMHVYSIIEAIKIAKEKGLKIPIIYNTNGYENVETIKLLNGYIDVYLPDLKYYDDELAKKYSKINNYFEIATKAIEEMYNQVGAPTFDERGMIKRGVIIRHLVLPNYIENSKQVIKWIKENIDENVYISVMAQYFPTYLAKEDEYINRKLTQEEYEQIENYVWDLDIKNGFMQDLEENEEEYVPDFDNLNF